MITVTLEWWTIPMALFMACLTIAGITDDVGFGGKSLFWLSVGTFASIGIVIGHFL